MRVLLSCLSLLLVLMAPVGAQDNPPPEPPKAEDHAGESSDTRKDDQKTKTKPEEAQAPDIIETTDRASEDLPLIFPADI